MCCTNGILLLMRNDKRGRTLQSTLEGSTGACGWAGCFGAPAADLVASAFGGSARSPTSACAPRNVTSWRIVYLCSSGQMCRCAGR